MSCEKRKAEPESDFSEKKSKKSAEQTPDNSSPKPSRSDCNYEEESYFYRVLGKGDEFDEEEGERYIVLDTEEPTPPTDSEAISKFIQDHNLHHGDVVCYSPDRAGSAFIVICDPEKREMKWIENPDDPGSGYLTIPAEVLVNVRDATRKYRSMMNQPLINFHLSGHDKVIQDKYGNNVPDTWAFDAYYAEGELDEFFIKFPGKEYELVNFESSNFESLQELCNQPSGGPQAAFNVKVSLEDAKFTEFKTKIAEEFPGNWGWLKAAPSLPQGWKLEKGAAMTAPTSHRCIWKLNGPAQQEEDARQRVKDFLQGFSYEFLQADQINI